MIVEFPKATTSEKMQEVIAELKSQGHSPIWEDTNRLSSNNKVTVAAMRKLAKK